MAKRNRRKKKSNSTLWQWVVVAVAAFLLYKGLDHFLTTKPPEEKKRKPSVSSQEKKPSPIKETAETQETAGPIKNWTEKKATPFLPKEAFEDNFRITPIGKKHGALLAYAKKIPGKKPGPKGLTNTKPGLTLLLWEDNQYRDEDLPLSKLDPALGSLSSQNFVGLPHVERKPLEEDGVEIFPAKIFLAGDDREIQAYLMVGEKETKWAPLRHASGKKMPAAFVTGTTKKTTSNVKHQKHGGKNYLIVENGILDEYKVYAGYEWNLQAYYWDGESFVYDKDFSEKLTKSKKLSK